MIWGHLESIKVVSTEFNASHGLKERQGNSFPLSFLLCMAKPKQCWTLSKSSLPTIFSNHLMTTKVEYFIFSYHQIYFFVYFNLINKKMFFFKTNMSQRQKKKFLK